MKKDKNFLDFIPSISSELCWKTEEDGLVTLELENKGFFKRLTQLLFKKPKISYIHLEQKGSAVWSKIDGERTVLQIGELLAENSEEEKQVIYANLSAFLKTLESYGFITLNQAQKADI